MTQIAPRAPARGRARLWLALAGGSLALFALGASLAVFVARDAIAARLDSLQNRAGLSIVHGAIDVPLFGGLAIDDIEVRGEGGTVLARLPRVETDVSLLAALLGKRRPDALTIRGAHFDVAFVDGRFLGLDALRRSVRRPDDTTPGEGRSVTVRLEDVSLGLSVDSHGWRTQRIALTGLNARLSRDEGGRLRVEGEAVVQAGGHRSGVTISVTDGGSIEAVFVDGFQLGVSGRSGPMWLGIRRLLRNPDAGETTIGGLGLRRGEDHVGLDALTVSDAAGGRLVPALDDLRAIGFQRLRAGRDDARLVASGGRVTLGPPGPFGVPTPRGASIEGIGVESPRRRVKAVLSKMDVKFEGVWQAVAAGRPLDAVSAVSMAGPSLFATVGNGQLDNVAGAGLLEALLPAASGAPAAAARADSRGAAGELGGKHRLALALLRRLRSWELDVSDGVVDVRDKQGAEILALRGVTVRTRAAAAEKLQVSVAAAVERNGSETGRVDGQLVLDRAGRVESAGGTMSGKDLAHQLSRFSKFVTVQPDAHVDVRFDYLRPEADGAPHRITGLAKLRHFEFEWWRIADRPIRDLEGEIAFDADLYPADHRVVMRMPRIRFGEARFNASIDLTKAPGDGLRFAARVAMPRQDCGAAARSIPKALIPRLSRLVMRGSMDFEASLELDLDNPRELELAVDGDMDRCHVLSLGPGIDIEALKGSFVHRPTEPERGLLPHIRVGRGSSEWIPGEELPELVKTIAWVTEDRRYFDHGGVRWDLIERALKMDLEKGRFVYGGSTVTQQLVKNLYLDRGKTIARKLEEALIAMQMERLLTKDEILTTYVNVIEYGPDIYGVKHAAMFYFNKTVDELSPLEIAFIMGLKPYPSRGYRQWQLGQLKPWWVRRMKHVLGMTLKRSPLLTQQDFDDAAPYQPVFRTRDEPMRVHRRHLKREDAPMPDDVEGAWEPWGAAPDEPP